MNKGTKYTLIAISAFVAAMVASFIWFVATWDKASEKAIVRATPPVAAPLLISSFSKYPLPRLAQTGHPTILGSDQPPSDRSARL